MDNSIDISCPQSQTELSIIAAVEPGTVVVTNRAFNVFLKEEHEIVSSYCLNRDKVSLFQRYLISVQLYMY